MKTRQNHKRKKVKVETYEELVTEIRKLIEEAKAKGVPLFERDDLLTCRDCGAYEDVLALSKDPTGQKRVFLNPKFETDRGFIVIDSRERKIKAPKDKVRYRTIYRFICGVCGAHQRLGFTNEYDDH